MAFTDAQLVLWSNVPGNVPTPDEMTLNGRIAINQADGKLFYRRSDGTVQELVIQAVYDGLVDIDDVTGIDATALAVLKGVIGIGSDPGDIVRLDGLGKLPAVDGSLLTNLPASGGGGYTPINAMTLLGNNTNGSAIPTGLVASQVRTLLALAVAATSVQLRAFTAGDLYITPAIEADALAFFSIGTSLTGTRALNLNNGVNQTCSIAGTTPLGQHTNLRDGVPSVLEIVQAGSGGYKLTGTNTTYNKFPGGTLYDLSAAVGARDILYGTQRVISGTALIEWTGFAKDVK